MAKKPLPTIEMLHKLLVCDAEAGKLYWRSRPAEMFSDGGNGQDANCRSWNSKFSGKEAFTTIDTGDYLCGSVFRRKHRAHRVIWAMETGAWPVDEIDHKDGVRGNNRKENLREATRSQNSRNQATRSDNTSGIIGVHWRKDRDKWAVEIGVRGNRKRLGYFTDLSKAVSVRKAAEQQHGYSPLHGREAHENHSKSFRAAPFAKTLALGGNRP